MQVVALESCTFNLPASMAGPWSCRCPRRPSPRQWLHCRDHTKACRAGQQRGPRWPILSQTPPGRIGFRQKSGPSRGAVAAARKPWYGRAMKAIVVVMGVSAAARHGRRHAGRQIERAVLEGRRPASAGQCRQDASARRHGRDRWPWLQAIARRIDDGARGRGGRGHLPRR